MTTVNKSDYTSLETSQIEDILKNILDSGELTDEQRQFLEEIDLAELNQDVDLIVSLIIENILDCAQQGKNVAQIQEVLVASFALLSYITRDQMDETDFSTIVENTPSITEAFSARLPGLLEELSELGEAEAATLFSDELQASILNVISKLSYSTTDTDSKDQNSGLFLYEQTEKLMKKLQDNDSSAFLALDMLLLFYTFLESGQHKNPAHSISQFCNFFVETTEVLHEIGCTVLGLSMDDLFFDEEDEGFDFEEEEEEKYPSNSVA